MLTKLFLEPQWTKCDTFKCLCKILRIMGSFGNWLVWEPIKPILKQIFDGGGLIDPLSTWIGLKAFYRFQEVLIMQRITDVRKSCTDNHFSLV